jgi:hypothetical protein
VVVAGLVVVVVFGGFPRAGATAPVTPPPTVVIRIAPTATGRKTRKKRRRMPWYRHREPEFLKASDDTRLTLR